MDREEADAGAADYWVDYGRPEPGSRIEDVPTLSKILDADGDERPVPLRDPGDLDPPPRLITYDRYIDAKFVPLEVDNIWKKEWQVACREEDIPNIGDRISYDIVDASYLVVRTGKTEFKAFYNSCRHRARKLCDGKAGGTSIRCGFHGWVFGLDGTLEWIPFEQEFPHVDAQHNSLIPVKTATWGGNVFINPDPGAGPLEEALGPLIRHFTPYPQEDRYTAIRVLVNVECNWKAAQEAFMEAYHVVETHADGMPMFCSAGTQIDIWSEGKGYVSRLCTPMGIDPYIKDRITPRQSIELFCAAYDLPMPPADRGLTQEDVRRYAAEAQRERTERETGLDLSGEPVSTFLEMAKYFMFPNFHPWWGGVPWWYRFTPYGSDPDRSVMELRVLLPLPLEGERPAVPEPILVDFGEQPSSETLGTIAHILAQDLANMTAVQRGFKAAPASAAYLTLSNYQEAKIRRFHEIYDDLLGLDTVA